MPSPIRRKLHAMRRFSTRISAKAKRNRPGLRVETLEPRQLLFASPIGFWAFDNPDNLGEDTSGNGNDLVAFGDAAYAAGGQTGSGGELSLDGNGDFLAGAGGVAPTGLPIGNSTYAISAWIKPDVTGTRGIVGWGNYGSGRQVNALRLFNDNGFRHYWWGADLDASSAQVAAKGADLDDGQWHSIVAMYDGSIRSLWLDGELLVSGPPGTNNASSANFRIGSTCTICGGEFFDGSIDDLAIWDTALTAEEISSLYNGASPVADPPTAVDDDYDIDEDQTLTVTLGDDVLKNDTDPNLAALTAELVDGPANGSLTLSTDGTFEYLPDADFNGDDTFTYRASNGPARSTVATVTIRVAAQYDPAVAVEDNYVVDSGSGLTVSDTEGVLANDENVDNASLSAVLVDDVQNGTLSLSADGSFGYQPAALFEGTDTFSYRVNDTTGLSNTVTVSLVVDSPPVANDNSYNIDEDQVFSTNVANGVLFDDVDLQSLTAILVAGPTNGQLTLNADGSFDYVPVADYFGPDSFTYQASDGDQLSNLATVTITIAPLNDPPVAIGDTFFGFVDEPITKSAALGVLANDRDVDGPVAIVSLIGDVASGTLSLGADGSFTYTPSAGFIGNDSFSYRVSDSIADSEIATVTLIVNSTDQKVVINEINYDPPDNTVPAEFIELLNNSDQPIDLSSWAFTDGINFVFPNGTVIAAGEYLVIAEDPATMLAVYGVSAIGPWTGSLNNEGEQIELRNALGDRVDRVNYGQGFPWPIAPAGSGASMELIDPTLDNDLGGSWRASGTPSGAEVVDPVTLLGAAATNWRYRKGTSEPPATWRDVDFVEDGTWLTGQTPIGYGDGDDNTVLADMRNNYPSVYLRNEFTVTEMPAALKLRIYVDDGAIVYINGIEIDRLFVSAGFKFFNSTTGLTDHESTWEEIFIVNPAAVLNVGTTNVIAIHSINRSFGSSDLSIDAEVIIPGSGDIPPVPTPAARNSVFSENAAPQTRQIKHTPADLTAAEDNNRFTRGGEQTVVTIKATDPDGVANVNLEYQIVAPGDYVPAYLPVPVGVLIGNAETERLPNPRYFDQANWTTVAMADDGTGADALAGDDIYTAVIPAQIHRTLVRYRVTVEDTLGASATVPYADDPSLNFAAFVYDGVPDFEGTSAETLESLPVYQFLTRAEDMTTVLAYNASDQIPQGTQARFAYNWSGTFVYDGKVYDNINYRLRGANGRYLSAGKRSMRFRFNKGSYFEARDQDGKRYPEKWRTLTTGKGFDNRLTLTYGLNEAVSLNLYNQIGLPASETHWVQFRVIDDVQEAPDQWRGDFWGLNFVMETYDVRFLKAHDLEKGNLYKLINQTTDSQQQQRYQASGAVTNGADHDNIENNLTGNSTADFIAANVNLEKYYLFHGLAEAIRLYDFWPSSNKNMVYYFEPEYTPENNNLGKLWVLPFDTDASWGPTWNNGHDVVYNSLFPASGGGSDGASTPELWPEYFNTVREIRDLLWQQDQIGPLLDEIIAPLLPLEAADRARWQNAPADAGNYGGLSGAGVTSLANLRQDMMNFAFVGGSWPGGGVGAGGRAAFLDSLQASNGEGGQIPNTPTISYTGSADFPIDRLSFQTTSFSDPQGAGSFAAMQWRIAEITDPDAPGYDPQADFKLEWKADWESGELTTLSNAIDIPVTQLKSGLTYRARVRMQDDTGRWSHWSAPREFTTTDPANSAFLNANLRISEIMYNPGVASTAEQDAGYSTQDFEYIELTNTGSETLDLTGARFSDGFDFDFASSAVTSLAPGEYVLVVRNQAAIEMRYGETLLIAGEFANSTALSNGGENITLDDSAGNVILNFAYDDAWYPRTDGDGYSLVIVDPLGETTLWSEKAGWRGSGQAGGFPGRVDVLSGDLNSDGRVSLFDLAIQQSDVAGGGASRVDIVNLLANFGVGMSEPTPAAQAAAITTPVIRAVDQSLAELSNSERPRTMRATSTRTAIRRTRIEAVDRAFADTLSKEPVRRSFRLRSAFSVIRSHRSRRSDV